MDPWKPTKWELADASALQALANGTADEHQQKRALDWILYKACRFHDMHYFPGDSGRRDTDYSLGRQGVGHDIRALLMANIGAMRRNEK